MNEWIQVAIVVLIVGGAVAWTIVRLIRKIRGKDKDACCGCQLRGKCQKKSCK